MKVVDPAIATAFGVEGSLGIAFHDDPVLGTVMYLSPGAGTVFDSGRFLSIVRLTDDDGDGNWGEPGEVNQAIVNNVQAQGRGGHQINQMQVLHDLLFVAIGSRTQNGGITTPLRGDQSWIGEHAYTGAVNLIADLTALSNDTTTPNVAGFNIANHRTDTQTLVSIDPSKLRVFSTGFRNNYGIAITDGGQIWVTMNQNEDPTLPDELHRTTFRDDHGFPKANNEVGDWKDPGNTHRSAQAAQGAGFFQNSLAPVALLGDHSVAGGLDFVTTNPAFMDHAIIARWKFGDVVAVDPAGTNVTTIATNFNHPLDVLADANGNLLIGEGAFGTSRIFRIDVVPAPEPSIIVLVVSSVVALRTRKDARPRSEGV